MEDFVIVGYNKDKNKVTVINRKDLKRSEIDLSNTSDKQKIDNKLALSCYQKVDEQDLFTIVNKFDGNTTEFILSDTLGNITKKNIEEIVEEQIALTNGRYETIGFEIVIIPKEFRG